MRVKPRKVGIVRRAAVATAMAAGLIASVGISGSPALAADPPPGCWSGLPTGWYCYFNGEEFTGTKWREYRCFGNTYQSYPSWLWDNARSWTHLQYEGAWIRNYNWDSYFGLYQYKFDMVGFTGDEYVAAGTSSSADTMKNNC